MNNFVWTNDNPGSERVPATTAGSASGQNASFRPTEHSTLGLSNRPAPPRRWPTATRRSTSTIPLPVSNDPNEPVRQKWISDTYQLLKAVLPPDVGRHRRGAGAAQPVRDQHHRLPRPGRHDDPLGQPGRRAHSRHAAVTGQHRLLPTHPDPEHPAATAACSTSTAWSTTRSRSTRCWPTASRAGPTVDATATYTNRFFIELVNTLTAAYNPTYDYGTPTEHNVDQQLLRQSGQHAGPGRVQLRSTCSWHIRSLLGRLLGPGLHGRQRR